MTSGFFQSLQNQNCVKDPLNTQDLFIFEEPMKIVHICDWYRPFGGAEKLMLDTLSALEEAGHTNTMIINEHETQHLTGIRPEYMVQHIEIDFSNFRLYDYKHIAHAKKRIAQIIAANSFDVCHIHNCQNPYIVQMLMRKLPCVRSIHDPRLYCFTQWRLLPDRSICPHPLGVKCLENKCLSDGDTPVTYHDKIAPWVYRHYRLHKKMPTMIFESNAQMECALQNGYRPDQLVLLPNFTPVMDEQTVRQLHETYYDPSCNNIVFVGRASYEKGLDVIIECADKISAPCTIHLLTDGPYMEHIRAQVRDRSLGHIIKLHGALSYDETRTYYARADLVVIPSVWIESFCLVGLEAMANMKPVVGSRIGGIKDWLVDGETGYHCEPGNARDLASKIDMLLADKKKSVQMGINGYKRVKECYDKKIYIEKLVDIYRTTIEKVRL